MSKNNNNNNSKSSNDKPPIEASGETVESTTSPAPAETPTSTAITTHTAPSTPGEALSLAYEGKVSDVYSELEKVARDNPEFGERLADVMAYMVARVEGMAGNQQVPIPYVNIRQGMTKEESLPEDNIKLGELYTAQERLGGTLEIIPLYMHFERVKFVQGSDRPDCSSSDGETGFKYGNCKTCPHSQRDEASDTRSACSFGYNYSAVSKDFTQLFQIKFMKTNAAAGKKLRSLSAQPTGIFSKTFKVSTAKQKNDKGEYYTFAVAPGGERVQGAQYQAARLLSKYFEARHAYNLTRQSQRDGGGGGSLSAGMPGVGGTHTAADASAPPDFENDAL
jgi:hypothetical protein